MFHYFNLEEIYEYAKKMGYKHEDVDIEKVCEEYDEFGNEVVWIYVVSFGHEYTETWTWEFDDLNEKATYYIHEFCDD